MVNSRTRQGNSWLQAIEPEHNKEPEQLLWISVLTKAADDALNCNDYHEAQRAINWFVNNSANFKQVCRFAGRDPEYVRMRLLPRLTEREREINAFMRNIKYDNIIPIGSFK
jgi:hypothetical protein